MGNKGMHNQGAQKIITDYERSKMLRVQENQQRLRELGLKNIANSLTSLAVAENTKKRKKKANVTNDKDVEYNPDESSDNEENYQDVATHVTAPKKIHRRQYIAPMSMNRYANLSKQRVCAPNISRVVPCVDGEKNGKIVDSNAEKRNQPKAGITMDVNEVDKEHDGAHDEENEEIENAIFESIQNGLEGEDVRPLDMSEDEISEDGLESEENDDIEHFMFENNQNGIESENDSEEGWENEDVERVEAQLDGPNMEKAVSFEQMKNYKPPENESSPTDPFLAVMNKEYDGYRRLFGRGVTNTLIKKVQASGSSNMAPSDIVQSSTTGLECDNGDDRHTKLVEVYERKIIELNEDNEKRLELMRKELSNERDKLVEDAVRKILEKLPPEVARKKVGLLWHMAEIKICNYQMEVF
ncbi:hypothetical protein CTI12_AA497080 [Artemisia annua]|uniref:Uncharacterized protein n=1 Tax=Artemisia annua TaxID=35608 RepID=A0A2U1LER6_ARTAN|nr:hypothetical protein CTI12_AA497080 [Artemisia annua]